MESPNGLVAIIPRFLVEESIERGELFGLIVQDHMYYFSPAGRLSVKKIDQIEHQLNRYWFYIFKNSFYSERMAKKIYQIIFSDRYNRLNKSENVSHVKDYLNRVILLEINEIINPVGWSADDVSQRIFKYREVNDRSKQPWELLVFQILMKYLIKNLLKAHCTL